MIIYKTEASDGLTDKLNKETTLAYLMPLIKWQPDDTIKANLLVRHPDLLAKAGEHDNDLYYTKSVLVTTNWNKNDDVFDKVETWAARHTPSHKPTNIEHDEKQLIGHITNCWAITTEQELIPDNTIVDDLPNIYHIVNGAVIYRAWRDQNFIDRTEALIKQIEDGKKYVSMECRFANFSYAIIKPDGGCHVIARDENTAWMTKHLRAYGGRGEYEGCKIGRLLKNITFSGKGYVDAPANPDSIIFNNASLFNFTTASRENPFILNNGVYLNRDISQNKENELMSAELDTLKTQLDEAKSQNETDKKLAQANVDKLELRIKELEMQLSDSNNKVKTYEDTQTKLTIAEKTIADLNQKVADMTLTQLTAGRIAMLIEGGIERTLAEKKVSIYATLSDEQFKDLATDLIEAAKMMSDEEKKKMMEDEKKKKTDEKAKADEDEVNADEKVLDDAKVIEDPSLVVATEVVSEIDTLRQELRSALASRLGLEVNNEEDK